MSIVREVLVKLRCDHGVTHVVVLERLPDGSLDVTMQTDRHRSTTDRVNVPWGQACLLENPQ